MKDSWRKIILFSFVFVTSFYVSNGCWMENVNMWAVPEDIQVYDVFRGDILNRETRDIESVINFTHFGDIRKGPYLTYELVDNRFILTTNEEFEDYEENEIVQQFSVSVIFRCSGGSSNSLVFLIKVVDTNNNYPVFQSSNALSYTIFTPTPPGTVITGCFGGITVRDIDLTTQRIDFTLDENPYFEIEAEDPARTPEKEFIAIIKTTTFIRTLPEPITLRITATDVDLTGDPPLSATTTVTIAADTTFALPEEPVFTQAFYLADYTDDNQLVLSEVISLQSGFDELVQFSLEAEHKDNFELVANLNVVTISVVTPLPATVLRERQIVLVVRAEREYTNGASSTVVVRLPEEVPLEFERAHYEGTIENNVLRVPPLSLARGYDGVTVRAEVFGEYATFFTANIQGNTITLSMETLTDNIINDNNAISLEIIASTEFSTARTIVTLEIIKDDNVTPVFNRPMYTGSYNTETGLTLEQIVFDQGYDETVELFLEGDDADLFTISREVGTVTLLTAGIPPTLFSQQRILLTLQATKPRTVGANAAIIITLPAARQLSFEDSTYRGTLQENILSLKPIVLSSGYDENVAFDVEGEFASYFTHTVVQNRVIISLERSIPENIIRDHNLIILTVEASGLNAISTTSSVLMDIIKEDTTTPVFSRNIYYGTYQSTSEVNIENINLVQGFDDDVTLDLEGDFADLFQISRTGQNIQVSLQYPISKDIIFNEKILVLNILANKPLTVGANAAIIIRFPSELTEPTVMRFEQNTYGGAIENNNLRTDDIVLSTGYQDGTEFFLTGGYSTHFRVTNLNNEVSLTVLDSLSIGEIDSNFIVLDLEARRERAISAWTSIVIDVIKQEVEPLVFSQPYYQGVYDEESLSLHSMEDISLATGFDETVTFVLEGDLVSLFTLEMVDNVLTLLLREPLPNTVVEQYNNLLFAIVATKPEAIDSRAAISIRLDKVPTAPRQLRFSKDYYTGLIEGSDLTLDTLSLEGYSNDVNYDFTGDYADYFHLTSQNGIFTLRLLRELSAEVIERHNVLIFTLEATVEETRTHTTIILEIVKDTNTNIGIAFEDIFYVGSYSEAESLQFNAEIRLRDEPAVPVMFSLYGSQSEWFEISQTESGVSIILKSDIPTTVIENNHQLIFAIKAESPDMPTATATIVIRLIKENTKTDVLRFDQVTYVGTIQNTEVTLDPITIIEGTTQNVAFSLRGDLANLFTLSPQGAGVVSVTLPAAIPDQLIPANRLVVLEIVATAPQTLPAYATIVFEVVVNDDQPSAPQLVFDATYYTGSYTNGADVVMDTTISLIQGYDQSVQFDLEGEHSQWFGVVQTANSATLRLTNSIPAAVLANNRHLVFVITAQRPGSDTARATIIIALTEEYTTDSILGFDQVTYVGTIQNTEVTLDPITIIEGTTQNVAFSLRGDLANLFTLSPQGAGVVSVKLPAAIPDQLIPANRLVVLEIVATAPQTLPAYATIVFEVVVDDDQPSAPQLVFDATYYTGSYTNGADVVMDTTISLIQGYDQSVQFDLEGEHSQWFGVVQTANSATLRLTSSIPAAVLANNRHLVFVITAQRPGSDTARATIIIALTEEYTTDSILGFDQVTYVGTIQNTEVTLDPITIIEGTTQNVAFSLRGDLANLFTLSPQGAGVVSVTLPAAIPDQLIPANRLVVLEIVATAPQTLPAYATIVFEVVVDDDQPSAPQLVFDATYYTGSYTNGADVVMDTTISLIQGYDQSVQFDLEGEHSQWFGVVQTTNSATLRLTSSIPAAVLANNRHLVFVITAQRPGSDTARATIIIALTEEYTTDSILGFDQVTYVGTIQNTEVTLDPITIIEGTTQNVAFSLRGDLANLFTLFPQGTGVVSVTLPAAIPDQLIPANRLVVLEIVATAPQTLPAYATIVFEVVVNDDQPSAPQLVFDATYYTGSYTNGADVVMDTTISLIQGYDQSVQFDLDGEHSQWFGVVQTANSATLRLTSSIPAAVLANNRHLVFVITAQRPGSDTARATIIIALTEEYTTDSILGFDQVTYVGTIQNTEVTLDPITIIEGTTQNVAFSLRGDLANLFTLSPQGAGVVSVTLPAAIPDQLIPANRLVVLEIVATAPQTLPAYATIVFEVVVDDDQPSAPQLVFDATYYTGSYTNGADVVMDTTISLIQGYDQSVQFDLEGEHSQWFGVVQTANSATLRLTNSIPAAVLANNRHLVFVITAQRPGSDTAQATIIIALTDDLQTEHDASFDKLVYEGIIQLNTVQHEMILISNYDGVSVHLYGDYSGLFVARAANGVVTVQAASGSLILPDDVTQVVLEMQAAGAQAVLLLNVVQSGVPVLPSVSFSSPSYVVNVNIAQTGYVGRVQATADNGEAILYSLTISDENLRSRLSINNDGELHLSAPADSGVYTFQVIATTAITRAEGSATVNLSVEAITVCGDEESVVVPPLIIIDRDEEEPHNNLVLSNTAQFEGCQYSLTNRWPLDQNWLYVDENGLHARSIDREHESIAFMTLSQVQVELILHCEGDNLVRTRRSQRTDWRDPYDYGTSNWILTESIAYNSRRSLVNLIVNDINDNTPIFIGKDVEPIAVGYPVADIEERILPRSLAELQATDADIGINAALRYWSSEEALAVSPTTGYVHVRNGALLQDNQRLTVSATDQNGAGLTGEIQLVVKLLDLNNIAVVTVNNAFLDDEKDVLAKLSDAVGYEIKVLRSVVISDNLDQDEDNDTRKKRETSSSGASLLLYIYGLEQREPVTVERLTTDINNNAAVVSVMSTVSLEEHLDAQEIIIISERNIGLLVATIILSVLLFIAVVVIATWLILRWRKDNNYEAFSDENSLESSRESIQQQPKPEAPLPRLNIEELKRSERRLQEMLNAPIEEITVEPTTSKRAAPQESIIDLPMPETINNPIVIQSIDKLKDSDDTDDEFGEATEPRRKSVVTFNENVEKIIHVEDDMDSTTSDYEVFKL